MLLEREIFAYRSFQCLLCLKLGSFLYPLSFTSNTKHRNARIKVSTSHLKRKLRLTSKVNMDTRGEDHLLQPPARTPPRNPLPQSRQHSSRLELLLGPPVQQSRMGVPQESDHPEKCVSLSRGECRLRCTNSYQHGTAGLDSRMIKGVRMKQESYDGDCMGMEKFGEKRR